MPDPIKSGTPDLSKSESNNHRPGFIKPIARPPAPNLPQLPPAPILTDLPDISDSLYNEDQKKLKTPQDGAAFEPPLPTFLKPY